jgi:TPR repeat protein
MFVVRLMSFVTAFVCISSCNYAEDPSALSETYVNAVGTIRDVMISTGHASLEDDFDPELFRFNPSALDPKVAKRYEAKGVEEHEKSAREGESLSQYVLACYYTVYTKNYQKALYWAEKSVEAGYAESMLVLGGAYLLGNGVPVDISEGVKWIILADAKGNEDFKRELNEIKRVLPDKDSEGYREGSRRAAAWVQSHRNLFFNPN